jgi:Transcriptional Coactivator p15 (PC4)
MPIADAEKATNAPPRNGRSRPTLAEPIIISKFWKNRRRNESVRVSLSEYEKHVLINVRVYCTCTDGIDRPTPKGIAMGINRLVELHAAITQAVSKAKELGLLPDDDGAGA